MAPLNTHIRRVLTGHAADGKAIFTTDDQVQGLNPVTKKPPTDGSPAITLIHRTTGWPATNQGGDDELDISNLQRTKPDGTLKGVVCEVVTIPPSTNGASFPMHRNVSLDYGVIMKGEIVLVLEDGVETTLKEGDVYVQRGTIHAWKNVTEQECRFMTVVIPSEKVVVSDTGETLDATKLPGLTD